jgi:hypothetical protein
MIPPCTQMGAQCHRLAVTLRVAELDDGPASADDEATWLRGHTERIAFGRLWREGDHLYTTARLQVRCKHLEGGPDGQSRCRAHGFEARLTPPRHRPDARYATNTFMVVERGREVERELAPKPPPRRGLPVFDGVNPCATAPCTTADHRRGAACCRDLQLEVMCGPTNHRLEALLRSRQSPYLCKVEREEDDSIGLEMISACGYLGGDGISCVLHDRIRANGRPAKPGLCFEWPAGDATFHPGCVFASPRKHKNHK